uniref:4-coumarate--CoA ligase n=1 Tax=Oryza brachyantha TaxID=4533 RepID=J3M2L2_ORYBR
MDKLGANPANSCALTPLGFLERAATVFGDCPSVVYHDTVFTWSQTHRRCLRLASALVSLGISRRDIVSVLLPNVPAMYEAQFAVPMSGAVLNSINTRLDARTVSVLLRHSGSKLIFVDPALLPVLREALRLLPAGHPAPRVVLVEDPHEKEFPPAPADALTYERLLEKGDPEFSWVRPASEWDPMILNYTSGTTSAPKGVVHCHRGIFLITVDSLVDWAVPPRPTYLWTLPMFHANGWSFPWGMAVVGGTNVCLRRVDAAEVYDTIARRRVTHLCGAPVVLNMLANAAEGVRKPLPGKVRILTAGAPPPAAVLSRTEAIGFEVSHGYGLTETAGLVLSCAWKGEWDRLPASVSVLSLADADVKDAKTMVSVPRDGKTVGEIVLRGSSIMKGYLNNTKANSDAFKGEWFLTGDVGVVHPDGYIEIKDRSKDVIISGGENICSKEVEEIVLRGGCVTLGYLNDEAATKAAIRDNGWFYTGDVGVMHPDGYLEIRDRSKDVIISGGENISSVEVESVLYGHPAVNEAAVVARPDEFWGETPCAFVSLKQQQQGGGGAVTAAEVIAWSRERMPRYMVPRTVVFRDELPKTSTGKIQKYVLRNIAKEMGPSTNRNSKM